MYVEQIYTKCLAQASYYIESDGIVAIVDPMRDVDMYIDLAKKRNASIRYVLNTHFHADFVSGHLELANKTNAVIIFGPNAKPNFPALVVDDHETILLGTCRIEVLHTPGHTVESTCFLLKDENGKAHTLFSGDTLFIGDVGRPDLMSGNLSKEVLADMLYDSIQTKIKNLPDNVIVYPGHGAGSACGKNLAKETLSTIAEQKKNNYALSNMNKQSFVAFVNSDQPSIPPYFFKDAQININGYESLDQVLKNSFKEISADELRLELAKNTLILDARPATVFAEHFLRGALNIGLDGQFAIWFGTLIDFDQPVLIVADSGKEKEVMIRLARIGFDKVKGYISEHTMNDLILDNKGDSIGVIDFNDLEIELNNTSFKFLDVRNRSEVQQGKVRNAISVPLEELNNKMETLDKEETYMIYCAGGYRSMIAASILKRNGFNSIYNIKGGMNRIKEVAPNSIDVIQFN